MKKKPIINSNDEVRELTREDMKLFKPTSEVLPQELLSVLPRRGRPFKENPKKSTTLRLDAEVLDFFKAQGKGWQTKINNILHTYVDSHR